MRLNRNSHFAFHALAIGLLTLTGCVSPPTTRDSVLEAEAKAVEFLAREVPAWSRENRCYSCHNNGDAARALYLAGAKGHRFKRSALADTTTWLARPDRWDENKGDPGFSDKRLANLQFASALATAVEIGQAPNDTALRIAARRLVADQASDGSWPIEPHNTTGSPATYGTVLATYLALRTLERANFPEAASAAERARAWLNSATINSVPSAATLLMLAARDEHRPVTESSPVRPQIDDAFKLIRAAQTYDGGWGPYADAPPEVFDTALSLLALAGWRMMPGVEEMLRKGRSYLLEQQDGDGGWPATTRPPGGESYAQRLSTTGWATLALLATDDPVTGR